MIGALTRTISAWLSLSLMAIVVSGTSSAETLRIRSIVHTSWSSEEGLGAVFDVQQDRDGYLWLTTANGVFRFDGAAFQSVDVATNNAVHSRDVLSVFIAPSGRKWFTTRTSGLILFLDDKASNYPFDRRCVSVALTRGLVEDSAGGLWVRSLAGLFHLNGMTCEKITGDKGYPGGTPAAILVDHEDTIWVQSPSGILLASRKGESFKPLGQTSLPSTKMSFLHEAPDRSIWLSDSKGLRRVARNTSGLSPGPAPKSGRTGSQSFGDFAFSQSGDLWATLNDAVVRFSSENSLDTGTATGPGVDRFDHSDGLTSNAIRALMVDRENNAWLGTTGGLDQLRRTPLTSVVLPPTLENTLSIAAGEVGAVWTGNDTLGLTEVKPNGQTTAIDFIKSATTIRRDFLGTIWVASDGPIHLWHLLGHRQVPMHYPNEETDRVVAMAVDRNNEPWINVRSGPTYHLSHGVWINENAVLKKKPGVLGTLTNDEVGNVWLAFENRLLRWDGRSYQNHAFPYGTIGLSVASLDAVGDRVWLAGSGGVLLFSKGAYHLLEFKNRLLPGRVSGVVQTKNGDLWINGFSGITHVTSSELGRWIQDTHQKVVGEHFDALDGLPGLSAERYPEPSVVQAEDGRIWFSTIRGIAWLDRESIERNRNRIPPVVFVTGVVANNRTYDSTHTVQLPNGTENVEIDYTAPSLSMPTRVQFRYRLDRIDADWQEAGNRRQAFYTRLSPGDYSFHVDASNNDGIWSSDTAVLHFTVAPRFYQTIWFELICCAALIALFAFIYLLRVRFLTSRVQLRMLERMSERERIARDLHDTFFQGIQGLFLRFNTGTSMLRNEEPAKKVFLETLEASDTVMQEGRELLLDLRADHLTSSNLPEALGRFSTFGTTEPTPSYKVLVLGSVRLVNPEIANEMLRVGQEAVNNAFKHSGASTIEVLIDYSTHSLVLTVRDNGRGLDPIILRDGRRPGHLGLVGMKERAASVGGKYRLSSEPGKGTVIEVEVPARIAYSFR